MDRKPVESPEADKNNRKKEYSFLSLDLDLEFIFKHPKIILAFILLVFYFFILPYFTYFSFFPIDAPLSSINFLLIFGTITLPLSVFLIFPLVFLYLSLHDYKVKMNLNFREFLKVFFSKGLFLENLLVYFLVFFTILSFHILMAFIESKSEIDIPLLARAFIIIFVFSWVPAIEYYWILKDYNEKLKNHELHNSIQEEQSDMSPDNLRYSYRFFIFFAILIVFNMYVFFGKGVITTGVKLVTQPSSAVYSLVLLILFFIHILVHLYYYMFLAFVFKSLILRLFFYILILIILIVFNIVRYSNTLIGYFSWFGLASNENIVLIKKDICDNLPSEICEKLKSSGRNENAKNKNYLCSENIKDYICLEDVKIIWNGSDKIYVSVDNDSLIIPIPKDYLLNKDFIRKKSDRMITNGQKQSSKGVGK